MALCPLSWPVFNWLKCGWRPATSNLHILPISKPLDETLQEVCFYMEPSAMAFGFLFQNPASTERRSSRHPPKSGSCCVSSSGAGNKTGRGASVHAHTLQFWSYCGESGFCIWRRGRVKGSILLVWFFLLSYSTRTQNFLVRVVGVGAACGFLLKSEDCLRS